MRKIDKESIYNSYDVSLVYSEVMNRTEIYSNLGSIQKLGYLGLEPRTSRLKAEYSTIELATLI